MAFGMFQGRQVLFLILCMAFFAVILYLYARIPVSYTHLDVYKRQMYPCAALAMAHDCPIADAQLAGLLHDCAKCIPNKKKLKMCGENKIPVTEFEKEHPFLLHAKLGAFVAKDKYGIRKKEILSAIAFHTTGKPDMSLLEKIVYIADYIEPGRDKAVSYTHLAQELEVLLELKVIADVGLVGFPNVGKSTFLSRVTNAQPKIANYHFTTLSPNLGVVDTENGGFVIADIPGLIEGASEGVGLGHEFLRHIERTRVLVHIVDAASTEGRDPVDDIYKINKELEAYNPEIAARPQLIAANKIDCIFEDGEENPVDRLRTEFEPKGIKVYPVSAATGQGIRELLFGIRQLLDESPAERIVFEQEFFPEEMCIRDRNALFGLLAIFFAGRLIKKGYDISKDVP